MSAVCSHTLIEIPVGQRAMGGILFVPPQAGALVVFIHECDSTSNISPLNRLVARSLLDLGFAILQPDLKDWTAEHAGGAAWDDTDELLKSAKRLSAIIDWLGDNPATCGLPLGLFATGSGAAAAMMAAALRPSRVRAVVTHDGRSDLAADLLAEVQAPTLMLIGSRNQVCIDHNRHASEQMRCKPVLKLIQGATQLFVEPGKLEQVASMSYHWFQRTLTVSV